MSDVSDRLWKISATLPKRVRLIAVSKTKPNNLIQDAYNAGQREFGENKVQEFVSKFEQLPKDILWHFIGHLQTNKVKFIAPFVHMIHSVDSLKLLSEINKRALHNNRFINCLLQVYIASEETKFGFSDDDLQEILHSSDFKKLNNVKIRGLMGMATNSSDSSQVQNEFLHLKDLYEYYGVEFNFDILSMGMSGDYKLAIDSGSNMIRVGSAIFGERNYNH